MRIVQVAPIEESVPPKTYGGVELVVYNLTEELVRQGHEVYLLASGDTKTSAHLIPLIPVSLRKQFSVEEIDDWRAYYKFAIVPDMLHAIDTIKPDLVHNHFSWRLIAFNTMIHYPMITTIHGPITSVTERAAFQHFPDANYVSISNNQRKALPHINWVGTAYNGVDPSIFDVGKESRDYFVFLGRTSPEKGLAEICRMIRQTPHKLKIAAKIDSVDREYFNTQVLRYIDGKQIEFIGEVDHEGKKELLRKAKALLIWLNWEEPFGMVVPEANAAGTPVIVNARGSMPELINDGVNGFLVHTLDEMRRALDKVDMLDPMACRNHMETYFSSKKMVETYLSIAQKIVLQQTSHVPEISMAKRFT